MSRFYVGIDVGGTAIKFGIFDEKKILLDKFSIATNIVEKNNEKHLLNSIFVAIDDYCKSNKYKVKKNLIIGIGLTMPGPVVNNKLLHAVNINWKKKINIVSEIQKIFGKKIKVSVLNDANAAALGEYEKFLKAKYNSMALITLGTGVGTGVIINGKLIEGKSGIAGELSHIRIDYAEDALRCNCGNVGCVETVAGAVGLKKLYLKLKGNDNIQIKNLYEPISAKGIIDKAKERDELANAALDKSFGYVSDLIVILMHVYEPEVVVIGGGLSNAGTFITKIIEKHLHEKIFMTKTFPKIIIAKLKNDAGIYGAVSKF